MPANVETMFYSKESGTPWHGQGTGVEKAKTSAQAIKLAGLDWKVAVGPVWAGGQQKKDAKVVEGRFSIYRESDGQVYATHASARYQPWQNSEAFEFMDSLLQDGVITYDTAGALGNGERIWLLAKLAEDMRVADDVYYMYMLITSSHDLNGAIQALPTNVRVVCQNTLTAALGGGAGKGRIKISHQPGMKVKLDQARTALRITTEANRRMAEWLDRLSTTKVKDELVQSVRDGMFGPLDDQTPARRRNAIEAFQNIYNAEKERSGQTAYAVVNTITGYADHALGYNGDSEQRARARMLSVIEGRAEQLKEQGLELLAAKEPKALLILNS